MRRDGLLRNSRHDFAGRYAVTDDSETELLRARWLRARSEHRLVEPTALDFATGGTGKYVENLGLRILVQPADPHAHIVDFDPDFWEWFEMQASAGLWLNIFGGDVRPTAYAACIANASGDGSWRAYLAMLRNGAVDAAVGERYVMYERRENAKVFKLTTVFGYILGALRFATTVAERYPACPGPWEVSVALPRTAGSYLSHFAEGWRQLEDYFDAPRCLEPGLLFHRETETLDSTVITELVTSLGAQLENAWQSKRLRFLNHSTGEFDWHSARR
jgi:hypothetical protein